VKLQRQTKFAGAEAPADERGDCFAACLASITGVSVDAVPNFCAFDGAWMDRANAWLVERGLMLVTFEGDPFREMREYRQHAIMIASGPGPRGHRHCVLWRDGALFHDPHPSDDGLVGDPEEFEIVCLLDADAFNRRSNT